MDLGYIRSQFPALTQSDCIYTDNAGGTQVLAPVIQYISDYYTKTNAQLGGLYGVSKSSAGAVLKGLEAGAGYINALPSEVVYGSSTTQLFSNLSLAIDFAEGDELVISFMDHEANIAPWLRIAEILKLKVVPWKVRDDRQELDLEDLKKLLTSKTRLVAVTHSSNMLGTINPVKEIASTVHANSTAQVVVDGVAYAPHRQIDVKALGVDFYCFSWYKVYGPHIAMLYASEKAQTRLGTLKHFFHSGDDLSTRLGLAGAAYELQSSIPVVVKYLESISGSSLEKTFEMIATHEEQMQTIILQYLLSKPDLYVVYGSHSMSAQDRMPLISFRVIGQKCSDVVNRILEKSKFGIRSGHMYSKRLMDQLGCDNEYAIRISLCHYNTVEEAQEFVQVLKDTVEKA